VISPLGRTAFDLLYLWIKRMPWVWDKKCTEWQKFCDDTSALQLLRAYGPMVLCNDLLITIKAAGVNYCET